MANRIEVGYDHHPQTNPNVSNTIAHVYYFRKFETIQARALVSLIRNGRF